MKYKKTLASIIIIIIVLLISRGLNYIAAYNLDKKFERENGIIKGTGPYFIERGDNAVLLVHGFGASPLVLRELADYLAELNLTVYAPLLPGHGTNLKDFKESTHQDWQNAAENGYKKLSNYKKIYVVGYSMGGSLVINLAAEHNINGIILMNSPVELQTNLDTALPLAMLAEDYHIKGLFSDKEDKLREEYKIYKAIPLKSIIEIKEIIKIANSNLNKVEEPVLIIQSKNDDMVKPESAFEIYKEISSQKAEIVILKESTHINITEKDRELAREKIYEFLKENV